MSQDISTYREDRSINQAALIAAAGVLTAATIQLAVFGLCVTTATIAATAFVLAAMALASGWMIQKEINHRRFAVAIAALYIDQANRVGSRSERSNHPTLSQAI